MYDYYKRQNLSDSEDTTPFAYAAFENDDEILKTVEAALQKKRVCLAYHPVISAGKQSRTMFYEGLIRLQDEEGRIIPAAEFISTVETKEFGRQIDCASLELGMKTLLQYPDVRLAINMSARSIGYPRWMRILKDGLQAAPTVGERLILEMTENSVMLMPEIVSSFMDNLHHEGVSFAIDSFGAGYTAFRHFREFFFDIVKIDRQFIHNIHEDADNQVLTKALLLIAKQFEMFTVAEGVEHPEEARFLQSIGIDCLQGYLFSAPMLTAPFMQTAKYKIA